MSSHYVFRCPDCGKYQACLVENIRDYTFKCRSCSRSARVWQQNRRGIWLHHYGPISSQKASHCVRELNAQNKTAGFYTYG